MITSMEEDHYLQNTEVAAVPARDRVPIPDHQKQEILVRFDTLRRQGRGIQESYKIIGEEVNRNYKVIGELINRMRPTAGAARMYLRSKLLRLTRRLVEEAKAPEIIEILSRPGIGVLDPPAKTQADSGGFFLSVEANTCGAVKVGVAMQQTLPEAQSEEAFDPFTPQSGEIGHAEQQGQHQGRLQPEGTGESLVPRPTFFGRGANSRTAREDASIREANTRQQQESDPAQGGGGRYPKGEGLPILDVEPERESQRTTAGGFKVGSKPPRKGKVVGLEFAASFVTVPYEILKVWVEGGKLPAARGIRNYRVNLQEVREMAEANGYPEKEMGQ